jgi:DNA repair ATPase RecN
LSAVLKRVAQLEQALEALAKKPVRAPHSTGIAPERLAKIETELKALRQSTAALHEAVTKDSRAIEKTLESHAAAISSVRAAISQNEELVEGIVETLQMLNGVPGDLAEETLAAAS